ncbi:MAG: superoxide dismutase [Nitrosopumilus sp.]|nr:superoxide dismutase [Nitrosopumilus sp.]
MVRYQLPKLPYSYDDLEPHIDKQTMMIHHQRHHQSYVDGLNKVLAEISGSSHPQYITSILSDLTPIPENLQKKIKFFGGGFENHRLLWEMMNPDGGGIPGGRLADSIDVYFNSFEEFKEIFSMEALSIEGSGWSWLVFNQTFNKIEIITTKNQDSPWILNKIPLLGLDLWEHAYYLKHQNLRADYISSWWNVVNWDYVSNRFSELSG